MITHPSRILDGTGRPTMVDGVDMEPGGLNHYATPRLVTLYGPKGEAVIATTLLDYARSTASAHLLPVVEALNRRNTPALVSGLVDHRGQPIWAEYPT